MIRPWGMNAACESSVMVLEAPSAQLDGQGTASPGASNARIFTPVKLASMRFEKLTVPLRHLYAPSYTFRTANGLDGDPKTCDPSWRVPLAITLNVPRKARIGVPSRPVILYRPSLCS